MPRTVRTTSPTEAPAVDPEQAAARLWLDGDRPVSDVGDPAVFLHFIMRPDSCEECHVCGARLDLPIVAELAVEVSPSLKHDIGPILCARCFEKPREALTAGLRRKADGIHTLAMRYAAEVPERREAVLSDLRFAIDCINVMAQALDEGAALRYVAYHYGHE